MPEQRPRPVPPRARPLAELAFDGPLDRVGELSRGWAVALITERPAESIGEVALEDLARESPVLLSALLRALRSDEELAQLVEGGRSGSSPATRIPVLAGAAGPVAVVAAVEALRGVVWDGLVDEFGYLASEPTRARRLTDLADRLAAVCAAMLPAALEGLEAPAEPVVQAPAPAPSAAPAHGDTPAGAGASPRARPRVVIVDERAAPETQSPEESPSGRLADPVMAEPELASEIQIRDERGDEGPAAWTRSIGHQLERFEQDRASFAVLLVEIRGAPASSWDPVEELISAELRAGTMTRERAGRYWLLSPGTDRLGAAALAARLTRSLEELVRARGMELSVAVGTAVCPEDGRRASALAAHADVGLYAARSEHHRTDPPRVVPAPEG